ncbi:MAG: hypothetical protein MI742_13885 [Desulfobacterales bacterium]|nr:hypothetical protein [Desulfobacterales bacterium]
MNFKSMLMFSGLVCFALAFFQVVIGFFPSVSLYFGAPEALTENLGALILTSFVVASLLAGLGCYALSGAGFFSPFPALKPVLVFTGLLFVLRGLAVVPEIFVVFGLLESSIPVAPRFLFFSLGALALGVFFLHATRIGWAHFPARGTGAK